MQSKIRVLSDHTINQIAAGEVIENPASVVKEFVENSIDANASEITVEIASGGRTLIRVTDNGFGMTADDAVLCLERHATSKIKNVDDIQTIMTMGFRGEAIPSIASISKFSILTCAENEATGTLVLVDGGRILKCSKAARSPGTTMEVRSLFFNVPVRKKFQRSPNYDTNEILKTLSIIALGNPSIKFELISNEKQLLSTTASLDENKMNALKLKVKSILGLDFAESLCPLEGSVNGYHIHGYIGLPSVTRQNRTGQYLFINNRPVQNSLISFSVRDGYGTTLPSNRHPVYVLHVTIPGDVVDVNVHPQKREVRLRQEQAIKELVIKSVEKALQNSGYSFKEEIETASFFAGYPVINPQFSMTEKKPSYYDRIKTEDTIVNLPRKPFKWDFKKEEQQNQKSLFNVENLKPKVDVIATIPQFILINPISLIEKFDFLQKKESILCLVDIRLCKARILFEKLQQNKAIETQNLLIPVTFELTPLDEALIIKEMEFLNNMGIEIYQSSIKTFTVNAIPVFLSNSDIKTYVIDLIHELKENCQKDALQKEKDKKLAHFASRTTHVKNHALNTDEAKILMEQILQCEMPFQCPLGKQIFAFLTKDDIKNLI